MTRFVKAIGSLAALLAMVVGAPVLLLRVGQLGGLTGLHWSDILRMTDTDPVILGVMTLAAWLAWLVVAASVFAEVLALLTRQRIRLRVPGGGWVQPLVATLVIAAASAVIAPGAGMASAQAAHHAPVAARGLQSDAPGASHRSTAASGDDRAVGGHHPALADPGTGATGRGPGIRALQASAPGDVAGLVAEVPTTGALRHTVVEGDDLWGLAERYYGDGTRWRSIVAMNGLDPAEALRPGSTLQIGDTPSGSGLHSSGGSTSGARAATAPAEGHGTKAHVAEPSQGQATPRSPEAHPAQGQAAPRSPAAHASQSKAAPRSPEAHRPAQPTTQREADPSTAERRQPTSSTASHRHSASRGAASRHVSARRVTVRQVTVRRVTVRQGDTLSGIAQHILGDATRWPELARANRNLVKDPDLILPGWKLRVPGPAVGSAARSTTPHPGQALGTMSTASTTPSAKRPARRPAGLVPAPDQALIPRRDGPPRKPAGRAPEAQGAAIGRATASAAPSPVMAAPVTPARPSSSPAAHPPVGPEPPVASPAMSPAERPAPGRSPSAPSPSASSRSGSSPSDEQVPSRGSGPAASGAPAAAPGQTPASTDAQPVIPAVSTGSTPSSPASGNATPAPSVSGNATPAPSVSGNATPAPSAGERAAATPTEVAPSAVTPSAVTPSAVNPSAASSTPPVLTPQPVAVDLPPAQEADGPGVAVLGGVGALLAAALAGALALRRRQQLALRRPGRRIPFPAPETRLFEQALVSVGSSVTEPPVQARGADVALGVLPDGDPLLHDLESAGVSVVVGPAELADSLVAAAATGLAVQPWCAGTGLVLAGDLPWISALDEARVTLPDTARAVDQLERSVAARRLELNRLAREAVELSGAAGATVHSLESLRSDPDTWEAWAPLVHVFAEELDDDQRRRVASALAGDPVGVSVLAVGTEPWDTGATVRIVDDTHAELYPASPVAAHDHAKPHSASPVAYYDGDSSPSPSLGEEAPLPGAEPVIAFVPHLVDATARRALVEIFDTAASTKTTPAPWWSTDEDLPPQLAVLPHRSLPHCPEETRVDSTTATDPTLLLLGPVELIGTRGPAPARARRQCIEYAAWILLHPGSTATTMARSLLVAEGTRRSNMSRLRTWLGSDPNGELYLPDAYSGRIELHPAVSSDWEHLQLLIGTGVNRASTQALVEALAMVRGAPLADAAPGQWHWAEELRCDMASVVRDIGVVLANRALDESDFDLARWAAARALQAAPADEPLMCARIRTEHLAGNRPEVERLVLHVARGARNLGVDLDEATVALMQEVMEGRRRAQLV